MKRLKKIKAFLRDYVPYVIGWFTIGAGLWWIKAFLLF